MSGSLRNWRGVPEGGCRLRGALAAACAVVLMFAAAAAAQAPRPSSAPPDPAADTGLITRPQVQPGDQWIYRRQGVGGERLLRQTVTATSDTGISLRTEEPGSQDSSVTVHDRQWGLLGSGFNDYRPALAYYSFPLYPGKRWGIDSTVGNFGAGQSGRMRGEGHAVGWEEVTVPAGRFLALRVEVVIETADPGDDKRVLNVREQHWYARAIMRPVRVVSVAGLAGAAPASETVELVSYKLD